VVVFEEQDTDGSGCLTLSRGELACRLAGYDLTLVFDFLFGEIRNQGLHQLKLVLSALKLLVSQHDTRHGPGDGHYELQCLEDQGRVWGDTDEPFL
jgi:hypothetical protein